MGVLLLAPRCSKWKAVLRNAGASQDLLSAFAAPSVVARCMPISFGPIAPQPPTPSQPPFERPAFCPGAASVLTQWVLRCFLFQSSVS